MYLNLPMKLWTLLTMNYLCYRVLGATLVRDTTWFLFDFGINNQLLLHLLSEENLLLPQLEVKVGEIPRKEIFY